MNKSQSLLNLDDLSRDSILSLLADANSIKNSEINVSTSMNGKILAPIFLQGSSRTFINSSSSFIRMGGTVLSIPLSNTRYQSEWSEPLQDFCAVINSCSDFVVIRTSNVETVYEFLKFSDLPVTNAGNGSGTGAEHPVQALLDLFTIQQTHGERKLNILMLGGKHIRSTRSQIKLFRQFGHELIIMSPESPVDNNDIDEICKNEFREENALEAIDLRKVDIIYHNGMDENPNVEAGNEYQITQKKLEEQGFKGKVMHSLPRKNEMGCCLDDTDYNLYFEQMRNSKYVFQSVYLNQLKGTLYA